MGGRAHHRGRAEGVAIVNPLGGPLTLRLRAEESGGALSVIVSGAPVGEGPPLHVHANEDELLYVLEGALRIRLGDTLHAAPAGALTFVPRGVSHTWQSIGPGPARLLVVFAPGAPEMERFFERFAAAAPDAPLAVAFAELGREAGMGVLGPPLAQSHPG